MYSIFFAVLFWLLESTIHFHIFDFGSMFNFFPSDSNELWMRTVICLLIITAGAVIDKHIVSLKNIQLEKLKTLKATMYNVQDIAGNSLNEILFYCAEAEVKGNLEQKDINNIKKNIFDAILKLKEISDTEEIIEEKNSQGSYKIKVTQPSDKDQVTK